MKIIKYTSLVLVSLFCILTLLVGTAGYFLTDNLKAVILMMTHSREELEVMLDKTYEEVDTFLETNPQYEVRPSNAVEEKLHRDKVITDEEFVDLLTDKRSLSDLFGTELIIDDKNNITDKSTGEKYSADKLLQMKNNSNASSLEM